VKDNIPLIFNLHFLTYIKPTQITVFKKAKNFIKSITILIKIIDKLKRYIISIIANKKILLI